LVLVVLEVALIAVGWSCARSYFENGRRQGIHEAIRELSKGLNSHCELQTGVFPASVEKALNAIGGIPRRRKFGADPYHAQLWILGDAIGEACWIKGHAAGIRRKAPAEGKIRVDFSVNELLQLGWLAHLGFQHMMPNYRGFEMYRFSGEQDALEGARAISKIESAVPLKERPVADLSVPSKSRQNLICEWWQVTPDRLTA